MKQIFWNLVLLALLLSTTYAVDYDHDEVDEVRTPDEVPEITELRRATKSELEEERKGQMDVQVIFIMFRKAYVKEKGIVTLANEFSQHLAYKHAIKPKEFVQTGWDQVGIIVTQLSDMMTLKDFGKDRKSVLLVQSGQERIIGRHVTEKEKQNFYKRMKKNAIENPAPVEEKPEKKEKQPKLTEEEKQKLKDQIMNDPSVLNEAIAKAGMTDL